MALWMPIVKAALPYVAQIAAAAIPSFSARSAAGRTEPGNGQQIEELQEAVIQNAESIRGIAERFQQTLEQADAVTRLMQRELLLLRWGLVGSLCLSLVSLAVAIAALQS